MPAIDALIGLVAFQNEYIDRGELLDAFAIWTSDTSVSLATILVEKGYITSDDCSLLGQIAARHLKNHVDPTELFSQMSLNLMLQGDLNQIASQNDSIATNLRWFSHSIPLAADSRFNALERSSHSKSDGQIADGIHRFRIVKEHARGGLGVVYVAEDRQFRRMVALKQIRNDRADQELYRQKFQQEAEVTGQLEHPGIVPIYALGMDEKGKPFYAMRFIKGETLQDSIAQFHEELKQKNTRFDSPILRQLMRRFIDVCNAIEYAHERGVIHRD